MLALYKYRQRVKTWKMFGFFFQFRWRHKMDFDDSIFTSSFLLLVNRKKRWCRIDLWYWWFSDEHLIDCLWKPQKPSEKQFVEDFISSNTLDWVSFRQWQERIDNIDVLNFFKLPSSFLSRNIRSFWTNIDWFNYEKLE